MSLSIINKTSAEWSIIDHQMMSLALQLAKKGEYTARPNPMVGCVLLKDEQIVGQGWHQKSGLAHAEINALKEAGGLATGATCYVTLEPCAHIGKTGPCANALIKEGVKKVVAAMLDPNPQVAGKGFQLLLDAGIEVEVGLLEEQAQLLNRGFISRFSRKRPWVTCKLAMSLDGRTALADGSSKWITGEPARFDVQKLRARQDAIITGSGTVIADDPALNVRAEDQEWFKQAQKLGFNQPARILFDRKGRSKNSARIFKNDAPVYLFCNDSHKAKINHVEQITDLDSLSDRLSYLAQLGFNQVLLESGHQLAGEFLKQGFIDELIVYIAPKIMGNKAMGLFDIEVQNMMNTPKLKLKDLRMLGDDIRLTYVVESDPVKL